MGGKNTSVYIQDNEITNLEQDTFGHKHIADAVVNSIHNTNSPFIIGIFGGWGTGKSSLLELIKSKLNKEKFVTVTIDAWRYSSAENLRRAFLVHVANELAPSLLSDLRRRLYTSEQETIPEKPSKLDKAKIPSCEYVLDIILTFLGLVLLFFGFLFIVFSLQTVITNHGIKNFWENFDWISFLDKFVELAFVPFLLTLINYLRLYVIQRPVTVIHERIDADELFTDYFEKVVKEALKSPLSKNKLILFVDNLDRLTDDKMVEALESLKTYLINNKCVFIVACDDNVVRSVVNNSPKIPKLEENHNRGGKAGEHYLDKFFQQTFRLPEYMAINLSDFALKNLETTTLYKELQSQNIDIRNLVSIILPSDVNSPRKVKRLLNEFIALFEIVKRRENEKDGQLKTGRLTNNIEFLGKFSTIRAEFPVFYKALIEDTTLINKITDLIQQQNEESQTKLKELETIYLSSLIAYFRKTQTILVDDVDPYIWLSQDALALGLQGNHNSLLRTALSDGDVDQVKSLIINSEDDEYKALLARVASRTVEQRLIGIEQRNGVKVISHLLPIFGDSIKPEIAHVAAKLMPSVAVSFFSAEEVFNVLRWARMGGINTQREKLVNRILDRLEDSQLRQSTFYAILQNADVIDQNNATDRVNRWLIEILSSEKQLAQQASEIPNIETEANAKNDENKINREFAEWLINQIEEYSGNSLVIRNYFSGCFIDYMVERLLGGYQGLPAVYLDNSEGMGFTILKAFNIISTEIVNGLKSESYWRGLLQLLRKSTYMPEVRYSLEKVSQLIDFCPVNLVEQFLSSIFLAIRNLLEDPENKKNMGEIIEIIKQVKPIIFALRVHKNKPFDTKLLDQLDENLIVLLSETELCKELVPFIESYFEMFDADNGTIFIQSMVNTLIEHGENKIIGNLLLDVILKWNNLVSSVQRDVVIEMVNELYITNDLALVDISSEYLSKLIRVPEYQGIIGKYEEQWLGRFGVDEPNLLLAKLSLYNMLINFSVFNANTLVKTIIPYIPFSGNSSQLQIVIDAISSIIEKISDETGIALFLNTINNIGAFGSLIPSGLRLISPWIRKSGEPYRTQFSERAYQAFSTAPNEIVDILSISWQGLTEKEIQNHIIHFYSVNFDNGFRTKRDSSVLKGLESISEDHRADVIYYIWNELINQGSNAEEFMGSAVGFMSLEVLLQLREDAIEIVRKNGASPLSEVNLRLLTSTIRRDVREIMPIIELFVNLFGRGPLDVQMAINYVVPCLKPLDIRNDHKHKLAEAMGQAALRTEEQRVNEEIHEKAEQLGLKGFWYIKHWN